MNVLFPFVDFGVCKNIWCTWTLLKDHEMAVIVSFSDTISTEFWYGYSFQGVKKDGI